MTHHFPFLFKIIVWNISGFKPVISSKLVFWAALCMAVFLGLIHFPDAYFSTNHSYLWELWSQKFPSFVRFAERLISIYPAKKDCTITVIITIVFVSHPINVHYGNIQVYVDEGLWLYGKIWEFRNASYC